MGHELNLDILQVLSSDVRVALSEERVIDQDSLPPWGSTGYELCY